MTDVAPKAQHFTYLLAPGWVRVDLRGDLEAQVDKVLERHTRTLGRDQVAKVRALARPRLLAAVQAAAEGGAYDLIVPVPRAGYESLASFVIAPLPWPEGIDAVEGLMALAASDSSATLAEVGGLVALRTQAEDRREDPRDFAAAALEAGVTEPVADVPNAVRVQYFIGDPERSEDWITAFYTIPVSQVDRARELVDAEVELFDSVMGTLRFN